MERSSALREQIDEYHARLEFYGPSPGRQTGTGPPSPVEMTGEYLRVKETLEGQVDEKKKQAERYEAQTKNLRLQHSCSEGTALRFAWYCSRNRQLSELRRWLEGGENMQALRWALAALSGIVAIGLAVGSYFLGGPRNLYAFLRYAVPRFNRCRLRVGDPAPDAPLVALDGNTTSHIRDRIGARPLVLIFGSYTWPPFRRQIGDLVRIYDDYKDRADFLAVYIREAHPEDEWQMKENDDQGICYLQPKTLAQRAAIANDFRQRFQFPIPMGIDTMSDVADHLYAASPERLYIVDASGKIVYRGGLGPFRYRPQEVRDWLVRRFPPEVPAARADRVGSVSRAEPG
jgi:hypothetical protein